MQEVKKGFTWGSVTIVPLRADEEEDGTNEAVNATWGPHDKIVIPFQNENLYVIRKSPGVEDQVKHKPSLYSALSLIFLTI